MTKKEEIVFAVCVNLIVILIALPGLIAYAGTAAISAQAYTADEDGNICLVAGRQIRVVSPDHTVITFRAPLNHTDAIYLDGQMIRVFSGSSFAVMDKSGNVVELGTLDNPKTPDKRSTVIQGDVMYRFKSFLGFYRITQETAGEEIVRYRMPAADTILRLIQFVGILLLAAFCVALPIYFAIHNRFAKDGTILPPQAQS